MLCDNKWAISIVHYLVYRDRIKHVDNDRFYTKEKLEEKIICITHVTSEEQCADIFTKRLPAKAFLKHVSKLGMKSIHSFTWGGVSWISLSYSPTQYIEIFSFIYILSAKYSVCASGYQYIFSLFFTGFPDSRLFIGKDIGGLTLFELVQLEKTLG